MISTCIRKWILKCIVLAAVVGLTACGSRVELHSNLTESDANEIYAALLSAGIDAEKIASKDGVGIHVNGHQTQQALAVLQSQGLPRDKQQTLGNIFEKKNLISSPLEERARYLYGLSQELEKTISTIDGVLSARVHIVLPEQASVGEPISPSSAAVFVKYREGSNFLTAVSKVRALVFNSVPGLSGNEREKVTVVALPSTTDLSSQGSVQWFGPVAISSDTYANFLIISIVFLSLWAVSLAMTILWFTRRELVMRTYLKVQSTLRRS